ncbi:MAG: ATP synthase F0 subunit B [Nitrospirae bacterium]|nr:ATP synthase F0 subunit B [Nitrospirota bacterium]
MIELQKWFFVLLANFIVLIILLRIILFKPLLALFAQRRNIVEEAMAAVRRYNEERTRNQSLIENEVINTNEKINTIIDTLKNEGVTLQKEYIQKAQEEALSMIEKAGKEISLEAEKARQSLKSDIETYASEILTKVL